MREFSHLILMLIIFASATTYGEPTVPTAEVELPVQRNLMLIVAPDTYYLRGEAYSLADLPTALVQVPGLEGMVMKVAPAAGVEGDVELDSKRKQIERLARRYKIPELEWIDPQPVDSGEGADYIEWDYPGNEVSVVEVDWEGPMDSESVTLHYDAENDVSRVRLAIKDPAIQSVKLVDRPGEVPSQRSVVLTAVMPEEDEPRRIREEELASAAYRGKPEVLFTEPRIGASNVPAGRYDIKVTFDREMGKGFSWTGGGEDKPPLAEGAEVRWEDWQTCVYPAQLEPGKHYAIGINSKSYQNFKDLNGTPVDPMVIYFTTEGADQETLMKVRKPRVVKLEPAHGDFEVDPSITEIRVTFDIPMGEGFSWTGGGQNFPANREGAEVHWTEDGLTCVKPVKLEADKMYRLGINSVSHNNFRSVNGVPADPQIYMFKTLPIAAPATETSENDATDTVEAPE